MRYMPPFGSTDPNAPYVDRATPGAVRGSPLPAGVPTFLQREIVKVITSAGFEPADSLQLASAIQTGRLNFAVAAGTANALTAALSPTLGNLVQGLSIVLLTSAVNTGPMTLNVDSLGVKALLRQSGAAMEPGDLPAGIYRLSYDGAAWRVTGPTIGELATTLDIATYAQAVAGALNDVLMSPLRTLDAIKAKTLGVDQTWQSVVRVTDYYNPTVYQNTTGRPIACAGEAMWQSYGGFALSADNVAWMNVLDSNQNDLSNPFFIVVPPGWYYKIYADLIIYKELR